MFLADGAPEVVNDWHLPSSRARKQQRWVKLTGTLAEPRFESALTVQPAASQRLPFTRFHTTLGYAQHQLQSAGRLYQGSREIVALDVRLPINLALTDIPLGQRLLEAPPAVHMRLQEPDLAALRQWQPTLPRLQGTLQGSVDLQGTYNALTLEVKAQPQQFGIEGSVTQIRGPMHLHGAFRLAPSMAEMVRPRP